ncbi:MAG: Sapep family Mn(2+)-dependent dipeptidase [Erysipelotrichales bacterium]|nr:Sapep family Mn(2+)-dependent dipeptidase [Erysipelotrichales bacterium]
MDIKKMVQDHREEMIAKLQQLVSYESVKGEASAEYPFGKVAADCLADALGMCDDLGFKTVNLDNYVGYAEIGSGEKLIGLLGHLDVVPLGNGWTKDPLGKDLINGRLYGRGTSDDKGPVVASMIAMKIVQELRPELNKRIRLIMGCDEESGSSCLAYYVKKEGHMDYGFTPDGPFPLCHGEKGHVRLEITASTALRNIHAGLAVNVVPNLCESEVKKDSFDVEKLDAYFKANDIAYTLEDMDDEYVSLKVRGVAAHASTPEHGKNAVSYTVMGLTAAGYSDDFTEFYANHIGLTYDGSLLGCACKDNYGELTFNVGVIRCEDHKVTVLVDIRYPITLKSTDVCGMIKETGYAGNATVKVTSANEPLFFEVDSPLVKMLLDAYRGVTGDQSEPVTMGGGTYARGIHNCVAFGGMFPNSENTHMHDADEFIEIDELLLQCEIYVHAILNLLDHED